MVLFENPVLQIILIEINKLKQEDRETELKCMSNKDILPKLNQNYSTLNILWYYVQGAITRS